MGPIPEDMQTIGPEELATILGLSPKYVRIQASQRPDLLPPRFRIGGLQRARLRWRLVDVRAWMERVGRESVERAEAEQAARAKAIAWHPKDW